MKQICIAGKNDIAVDVLLYCIEHYGKENIICVLNRNESGQNTWQKSLKWFAEKNDVKISTLEEVYDKEELLFLSLEFDKIVNPDKFVSKQLYNIHFSKLPKYKGMFTSVMPILNGEKQTGVTLHRIDRGIDTGDIIDQVTVDIEDSDSAYDLYLKLIKNGTELIISYLDRLLEGNVEAYEQPSRESSYYSKNTIDFGGIALNVNQTAYQIQNQIRAFCFRPYQLLNWNGESYIGAEILQDKSKQKPGTVIEDTEIFTIIASVDYNIKLYKDVLDELLVAIESGKNERAKYLCACRKIVEHKEKHGWTALTVSVYNNNRTMTQYLLQNGADIHIVNNNGTNLLMYAKDCYLKYNDDAIFRLLLEAGCGLEMPDYSGKTLAEYCEEQGLVIIEGSIKTEGGI